MKKNKLIALFAGLSLAFVGSAALAAPSADTLLVAGYDSESMAVLYGVSEIDVDDPVPATLDCTVEEGAYVYVLNNGDTVSEDTIEAEVTSLKTKGGDGEEDKDVEFFFENDEDRNAGTGVVYGTETTEGVDGSEECALTSVKIEPNGAEKITHGTIVSTFAKLLKGGNGCMIKLFAQSEFGKAGYEDAEGELTVTLDSFQTACAKGKDKKVDDDSESGAKVNGKDTAPGLKDKADKATGKDGAPGQQNKKAKGDDDSSND